MSVETARPLGVGADDVVPENPLQPLPAHWRSLPRAFVHVARERWSAPAIADSTGVELTYGRTLTAALALGRVMARELGPEPYIGLLLPPTVGSAVANLAVSLRGKIPVNLNYSAGQEAINSAIAQCGIREVLTSPKVLNKLSIQLQAETVMLEDLRSKVSLVDKLGGAGLARLAPVAALGAVLPGLKGDDLDATATVIFTSGSTGEPKGVVLSHRNILSNVQGIQQHLHLEPEERLLGVLPFFHSMGFTVTLWTVLCLGKSAVYHFDPLAARVVGELCQKHQTTLLIATPTFMRSYLQRCPPEQFATVSRVVLGAEKLKPELARDIRERLGIEPLEGYGCTETAPVVSVNVPHEIQTGDGRTIPGNRPGTVGRPLPGTALRTTDPDTEAPLPHGAEGVIEVKGPQVMVGYLNRPEATAKVLRNGWYATGDIGQVDDDGFLRITDRLSRFAKIGGEMVPHERVEVAIRQASGVDELQVAVTALPDPKRGERLVVLHTDLGMPPGAVCQKLTEAGLPKLWIPSPDDFLLVDALPVLGTGKVDLRQLRQIAQQRLERPTPETA